MVRSVTETLHLSKHHTLFLTLGTQHLVPQMNWSGAGCCVESLGLLDLTLSPLCFSLPVYLLNSLLPSLFVSASHTQACACAHACVCTHTHASMHAHMHAHTPLASIQSFFVYGHLQSPMQAPSLLDTPWNLQMFIFQEGWSHIHAPKPCFIPLITCLANLHIPLQKYQSILFNHSQWTPVLTEQVLGW